MTGLNQNPETVLHYTTYKCPTTPRKILNTYQHRSTADHVSSELFCCRLGLIVPDPSDFPLTVKQLKRWQNMKAAIFHFGRLPHRHVSEVDGLKAKHLCWRGLKYKPMVGCAR